MDWMWVVTKREQPTSLPRFWPERGKEGLAVHWNEKSVLEQHCFSAFLKIITHPQGAFLDFFI